MPFDWMTRLATACVGAIPCMLIAWAACRLLPRLPATVRCWLWWLACLKLIVGLAWMPALSLPVLPNSTFARQIVGSNYPAEKRADASPRASIAVSSASSGQAYQGVEGSSGERSASAVSAAIPSTSEASTPMSGPWGSVNLWSGLLGVWLVGIGVALGMQVTAMAQLRRLTRAAVPFESAALAEATRRAGLLWSHD